MIDCLPILEDVLGKVERMHARRALHRQTLDLRTCYGSLVHNKEIATSTR